MIPAIVSSTATTVAVFLPISIIGGMISSTFISLLVIPIMYEWLSRKTIKTKFQHQQHHSA
ncbi:MULTISPECIES: efflux RND transporter permease subunit [Aeribacillus]|uniref:efflux RND transporter permease subunit n=1 Tax=Aeribacillus TaxID=1055323 RepID=UPI0007B4B1BE|nr:MULTISPECIES: efflux RND transporter permease subunit [Aeribacillus]KZM54034.1 hypothetical protein A3Q35_15980 [Aeribacillus pallidus]MED0651398.1 efflux RND transporter permease subunit [Aeribacillus composti]MED0703806.1 efflux RND transporter permease subunit [Aeribacillus composti]MED4488246.1 efflux RND transporter permease subunit [Aeribacillus pallidus]